MNDLHFGKEGQDKLIEGITLMSKAVKSTLGPLGKTVIIESQNQTRGMTITKDGVTVAKSIELEDPVANLAVKMMKDAADRTATSAGDGTTTAIVITEAMVKAGIDNKGINMSEVTKIAGNMIAEVIKQLEKTSKDVTGDTLTHVATISSNNDPELGEMIANVYKEVGNDGVVTVEKSKNAETHYEVTNGIKIDRGYTSRAFVNNVKTDECILEGVHILVTDLDIDNILNIEQVLKPIIQGGKKLLIIGNCSPNVVNTLGANVIKNNLKFCNIVPPQFGYKSKELMEDIAYAVDAKFFSDATGDDLSLIDMEDLGYADKVIVGRERTVIIRADQETSEVVNKRTEELREAEAKSTDKAEKDFLKERIASLNGGVGVIYIGGNSDVEQKELFDRADDAVCAVRSAIEEGVLPGGGSTLWNIYYQIKNQDIPLNREIALARDIVMAGLLSPIVQIMANADIDFAEDIEHYLEDYGMGHGYDVKRGVFGNMYEMGIIDPTKVTKNALINAFSVAITILTTNAIITYTRA